MNHCCVAVVLRPAQIGDLDFTKGVVLDGVLRIVVRDRWQPRVFMLSRLLSGMFFWAGTRSDIIGAICKVRWGGGVPGNWDIGSLHRPLPRLPVLTPPRSAH